jgi:uncharacterized membrane protein
MLREIFRVLLVIFIVTAGVLHFAKPEPFVKIVPPYLPYPLALVYISGFFEILGGVGLLITSVSQRGGVGFYLLVNSAAPLFGSLKGRERNPQNR